MLFCNRGLGQPYAVARASALLAVGAHEAEARELLEVAARHVLRALVQVGVLARGHVAHEALEEPGKCLALARIDLSGGRLIPESRPLDDSFYHQIRGVRGASEAAEEPDAPPGRFERTRLGGLELLVVLGTLLADLGGQAV